MKYLYAMAYSGSNYLLSLLIYITSLYGSHAAVSDHTEIDYIHQDLTLSQIRGSSTDWISYHKPIFNGINNGVYWFRMRINFHDEPVVISIESAHLTDCQLFRNDERIAPISGQRYFTFKIDAQEQSDLFYLKVHCQKEAYIPISINSYSQYDTLKRRNFNIYFAYYGFMGAIILFSLISFFQYNDSTYLFYILLTTGVNLPPAIHEGFFNLIVSPESVNYLVEPIAHLFCGLFAALFSYKYLNLAYYENKFIPIITSMLTIGLTLLMSYIISRNYILFVALDVLMMVVLSTCAFYGVQNFNKNNYAKFFSIALCPLLIAAYDFYIFPVFGIQLLGLSLNQYRIGNVFELIVFTIAIGYRGRLLKAENRKMQLEIQDLTKGESSKQREKYDTLLLHDYLMSEHLLTNQEIRVFDKVLLNKSNREIANELFISANTVKYHTRHIYQKLNIHSRREAQEKVIEIRKNHLNSE